MEKYLVRVLYVLPAAENTFKLHTDTKTFLCFNDVIKYISEIDYPIEKLIINSL